MGLLDRLVSGVDSFFGQDWFLIERLGVLREDSERLAPSLLRSQVEALIPKIQGKPNLSDRNKHLSDAHTLVAKALQRSGLYEAAVASSQEALRLTPGNGEAETCVAISWAKIGLRTQQAAEAYSGAIARGAALSDAYPALAEIHFGRMDEGPAAVEVYRGALQHGWQPGPAPAVSLADVLARLLYRSGKLDAAISQLTPFCTQDAPTPLLLRVARLLVGTGRLEAAQRIVQWLDAREEGRSCALLLRAQAGILAGHTEEALRALAPEIGGAPSEARVLRWVLEGAASGEPAPPETTAAAYLAAGLTCLCKREMGRAAGLLDCAARASDRNGLAGNWKLPGWSIERSVPHSDLTAEARYWTAWAELASGRLKEANTAFAEAANGLPPERSSPLKVVLEALNSYANALAQAHRAHWAEALTHLDEATAHRLGPILEMRLRAPLHLRAGLALWYQDQAAAGRQLEAAVRCAEDSWSRHAWEILCAEPGPTSPAPPPCFSSAEPVDLLRWLKSQSMEWETGPAERALADLKTAVDGGLSLPAAFCWGALLAFKAGDEAGQRDWSQQLTVLPAATRAHKQRAALLQLCRSIRSGKTASAEAILRAAPGEGPAEGLVLAAGAFRAYFERRPEIAEPCVQAALPHAAGRDWGMPSGVNLAAELRHLHAALACEAGNPERVVETPDLLPESPEAMHNLALLADHLGAEDLSRSRWEQTIGLWESELPRTVQREEAIVAARRR